MSALYVWNSLLIYYTKEGYMMHHIPWGYLFD